MGMSRNTWVLMAVAALAALVLAVPAFATTGDSGYMAWDSTIQGGYPYNQSPHGGYLTTTQKCVVCHAVHNADPLGEVLLRGTIAEACEYCHVGGAGGYTQVYGGVMANYYGTDSSVDTQFGHQAWDGGGGVTCTKCHQVHAAGTLMTDNAALSVKLLVGDKTFSGSNYDGFGGAPLSTDDKETALTKWCTACHDAGVPNDPPYNYYNGIDYVGDPTGNTMANNFSSHVMTDSVAVGYTKPDGTTMDEVAYASSEYCQSCHNYGYGTNAWPHFTPTAARFLSSASGVAATVSGATDTEADGVCLRCHRNGDGTVSGVGLDF